MGTTFFVSRNCLVVYPVSGPSMEPNLWDQERILLFRTQKIDYDDIIVFEYEPAGKFYVKRVIGLEGDTIDIQYNYDKFSYEVLRNGSVLVEDYIKDDMTVNYQILSVVVPEGKFFFLGDNRNVSYDSHYGIFGEVSKVEGKVFLKYGGDERKVKFI